MVKGMSRAQGLGHCQDRQQEMTLHERPGAMARPESVSQSSVAFSIEDWFRDMD
jgi:hypothetical protein